MKYDCDCKNNNVDRPSCRFYIGSTEDIVIANGSMGVSIISNPKSSNVNLLLNGSNFVNLSPNPIRVDVYSFLEVTGDLKESDNIIKRDLSCSNLTQSEAQIYYGIARSISGGLKVATLIAPPFSVLPGPIRLPLTLPPGSDRIAIFTVLGNENNGVVSVIHDWSEVSLYQ